MHLQVITLDSVQTFLKFFDGLNPTIFDGEFFSLRNEYLDSNNIISFFNFIIFAI